MAAGEVIVKLRYMNTIINECIKYIPIFGMRDAYHFVALCFTTKY